MSKVLIIGAGGVGGVVTHKCAQAKDTFSHITLASRTLSKCEAIKKQVKELRNVDIEVAQVDADNVAETVALIKKVNPKVVINVALPYQDLPIMDACLEAGVDYLDTANYEPRDEAKFEYKWQWAYQDRYKDANLMALMGSGFDPGVTNIFCAYAQKHHFDDIHEIDIVDCNAGDHGKAFATNFNPEINLREVSANGRYWRDGEWIETKPLEISEVFDFPEVGERKAYLLYHEELESLVQNIKGLKQIRFWMTFGDAYIKHMEVLENVGMMRIDPVDYKGQKVIPMEFLKCLLPDPGSLAENYTGKTSIGCIVKGVKDGKPKKIFVYNVCDHAECYKEVRSQAVSYTTGVPAMIGAKMIVEGKWRQEGVAHMEQQDPDPFLDDLAKFGLPWHVKELPVD
ncbi:MAG: saccharopine dehydrogenase family protein [Pseudobacteriovorax sp.]|nr:saccharopine dehydrogenase family protein [Pseudobacteriovorax sp.]